jgi:O-antigen/teichoic acid export membrane protein
VSRDSLDELPSFERICGARYSCNCRVRSSIVCVNTAVFVKQFNRPKAKMSRARILMTGVLMNWTAFAVSVIVSLILSPFVVHRLGNIAYGVWVLANSSIAYMALLDLGMRGAVTHFVAKHQVRGEHLESSRAVSVALAFRTVISIAVIVASLVLAAFATRIFRVPSNMWTAAQWAIVISGFNLSFSLIVGVFGGVITALQRFGMANGLAMSQTLISAAGTVWVLSRGYGVVPLAIMQLTVALALGIATIIFCGRVYPELRLGLRFLDRSILPELWHYSFYLFLIAATGQVIYYTDNLIVGAILSAEAVTFYAIGGRFIAYLGELGASLAQTFMPVASNLAAQDQRVQLRRLLIQGTRIALLVSLPVGGALFFRSSTFIGLWMGEQYAQPSGRILRILLLSTLAIAGNRVGGNIVLGLGRHKPFALWQSCEAVANLTLSIYLVRKIGINGVAWGTVIPSLASQIVLWPRYLSKLLGLNVWSYFRECWIRPALASAPFCFACLWTDHYWVATNMVHFFLQIAAVLPLIPLGIALFFWKELNWQLQTQGSFLRRTVSGKLQTVR